jgi:hypothetical protein
MNSPTEARSRFKLGVGSGTLPHCRQRYRDEARPAGFARKNHLGHWDRSHSISRSRRVFITSPQMPSLALRDRASSSVSPRASPVPARRIFHPFGEILCRYYLPKESVLVREPSAFHFLPAASSEFLPVIIDLLRVSQLITNETASVNLNCGPPFKAVNSWPFSSNETVITWPFFPEKSSPV